MIARNVAGLALWGAMLVFSSNAGAQSAQQAMEEAAKVYSDWVVMMAEITKGIEVKDSDFRDYLAHWEDLNKLDLADMEEENPQQFKQNVRSAIADPQYRSWAVSRGLDPEAFIRRSMRINSLFMVQMQEAQEAGSAQQYAQHAAMVEKQCAQVDAETCQQMRAMGAASKAMAESMRKARRQIPPATSREQALFDKYGPELEAQMLAEDEDDESGYGGYEEDY